MNKKLILCVIAVMLVAVVALSACGKPQDLTPGDSTVLYDPSADGMQIVDGEDSHAAIKQAYEAYKQQSSYKAEIDFVFKATAGTFNLYQSTYQKQIRNGSDFYEYYIVAGSGVSVPNDVGSEFYYTNGDCSVRYANGKKKIKLDENDKVTADLSSLPWGYFDPSKELNGAKKAIDRVNQTKDGFLSYHWDTKSYLSDKTDAKVYKKGDSYFCTIIINTTSSSVKREQPEVVAAIEKATGGNFAKFNEDTRMVAELEKTDKGYRFVQFVLQEDYTGVKNVIGNINVTASQQYWYKFAYSAEDCKFPQKK